MQRIKSYYEAVTYIYCAHRGIRTPTPLKAPPPQDGMSTNFTIWAMNCSQRYKKTFTDDSMNAYLILIS
jgi:hypothetical protein